MYSDYNNDIIMHLCVLLHFFLRDMLEIQR